MVVNFDPPNREEERGKYLFICLYVPVWESLPACVSRINCQFNGYSSRDSYPKRRLHCGPTCRETAPCFERCSFHANRYAVWCKKTLREPAALQSSTQKPAEHEVSRSTYPKRATLPSFDTPRVHESLLVFRDIRQMLSS